MTTKPSIDLILVKASATAIVTLALFRLPEVFRATVQLLTALITRQYVDSTGEAGAVISKLNQSYITSAIGDLIAFVVLLLLARWMFGVPKFMRSAFKCADDADKKYQAEQAAAGDGDNAPN